MKGRYTDQICFILLGIAIIMLSLASMEVKSHVRALESRVDALEEVR